ncbi:MAG: TolC family protein, partial [Chloroflexota bacterium]
MVLRRGWVIGLGLTLAAGSAFGQAQPNGGVQSPPKAKPATVTKVTPNRAAAKTSLAPPGTPHTLAEALTATYSTQPQLLAERAKLRATDESVPQALSGWRPTVIMAGTTGYGDGVTRQFEGGGFLKNRTDRLIGTAQATLTQPLYNGGKTPATINRAKNQVMAERATLIQQEQTSFIYVVNAYVGVIQAQQVLA